jgi:hypothetical protein
MEEKRRNPYLILGVPYGSGREEATRAFAKASRRARREEFFPHSVEDLTWALNQIKAQIENPSTDLNTFRLPADPDVLSVPSLHDSEAFKPKPIERRTPPVTQQDLQDVMDQIREELLEQIIERISDSIRKTFEVGELRPTPSLVVSDRPTRPRLRVFGRKGNAH